MKTNPTEDVKSCLAKLTQLFGEKKKKKDCEYKNGFDMLNRTTYFTGCQDYYPAKEAGLTSVYLACDLQVIHGSWMLQWPGAKWSWRLLNLWSMIFNYCSQVSPYICKWLLKSQMAEQKHLGWKHIGWETLLCDFTPLIRFMEREDTCCWAEGWPVYRLEI